MTVKAKRILHEIVNTLELLQNNDLILFYQNPKEEHDCNLYRLTWPNHQAGRLNAGNFFGFISQYKFFLQQYSYTCILYDGSLIKASYTFSPEGNCLKGHNLWYWPCPFLLTKEDLESPILDIIDLYESDPRWMEYLKMKTPMRFDFSPEDVNINHPASHLHIQTNDCRFYVNQPMTFNCFIKFIFNNFYHDAYDKYDFWDDLSDSFVGIEYECQNMIQYSGRTFGCILWS